MSSPHTICRTTPFSVPWGFWEYLGSYLARGLDSLYERYEGDDGAEDQTQAQMPLWSSKILNTVRGCQHLPAET